MLTSATRIPTVSVFVALTFVCFLSGLLATPSVIFAKGRQAELSDHKLSALTAEAYIYTLPSVIMFKTRQARVRLSTMWGRQPFNRFAHLRRTATPASRAVTTPSADLLYSSAWLDLTSGPLSLSVPETGQRYYSLQFMDFFTNSFAYIGRRTGTIAGGKFLIAGPSWRGAAPAGHKIVRAPTNSVWLLGRIWVDDKGDVPAVHALQDGLQISPSQTESNSIPATSEEDWDKDDPLHHFVIANRALTENPPPKDEKDLIEKFAQISVGPGKEFPVAALSNHHRQIMQRAIAGVDRRMAGWVAQARDEKNGWSLPSAKLGNFGKAYFFRAFVAKTGLGANIPDEAMYFRLLNDHIGEPPNGAYRYELHFPAGALPPVDAFWSITAYKRESDLRQFLVDNPIDRYVIGNRTPGLRRNADGSLTIYLQHEAPQKEQESNWLPIPAAAFGLVLRAYQPGAAMLNAEYQLPAVRRVH